MNLIRVIVHALLISLVFVGGCGPASGGDGTATASKALHRSKGAVHALALAGFNYTNRYIDEYEVDGAAGGNMDISDETSGGSKTTCCVAWVDGTYLPTTAHVRWVSAGCMAKVTNSFGETREVVSHTYSEANVPLNGPVPADPQYFETHFYPDGHVEVAITKEVSEPRLKLSLDRQLPESQEYPPCKESKP